MTGRNLQIRAKNPTFNYTVYKYSITGDCTMRGPQIKPTRREIAGAWATIRSAAAQGDVAAASMLLEHEQAKARSESETVRMAGLCVVHIPADQWHYLPADVLDLMRAFRNGIEEATE